MKYDGQEDLDYRDRELCFRQSYGPFVAGPPTYLFWVLGVGFLAFKSV